jgi:hypothetical protein
MRLKDKALNLTCKQGATFNRALTYRLNHVVVNLTGYTARMQVRPDHTSENLILNLSVGYGLAIDGEHGKITITVTAGTTATIPAGTYVYDLEIQSDNGEVTRLLEGKFIVTPEVTR